MFILDTDVLSDYQRQRKEVKERVDAFQAGELYVTVVTVLERLRGWYDEIHSKGLTLEASEALHQGLIDSISLFTYFEILPYSVAAMKRFQKLKSTKPSLNVRGPDLKIASIALEFDATVITFNERDFKRVPNLKYLAWSRSTS